MCGITGFAGIKTDPSIITSMIGIIRHRGPDDNGYAIHEDLAIGMTRLSIVDIAGGAQPIHSSDGALSIVFNGEIYNYPELAEEYRAQGGILRTHSDTEIILVLYERLGATCLEKLRGMFAFAVLDRREKSIFIARDRIGIKPLYYCQSGSTLIFGSEIKSLLASGQLDAQADMGAVARYLSLRYVSGPGSLFKGIQRLAPGHWMKWQNGTITERRYWQPQVRDKQRLSDVEFQEQFDALFEESVDIHRMGDVPHGAYLSGGLDSASIVNALARHGDTHIKTFTVGFGWEKDELAHARESAKRLGTDHHEVICTAGDFAHLPKIVWHSDEPLGDPIVIPTYMLAKEASQHVKIVLTGEGADEILGGYLFHQAVYMANLYRRFIPAPLHAAILPFVRRMPVSLLNKGFNYPGYLGESGKQRLLSFLQLSRNENPADLLRFFISLFNQNDKQSLLTSDFFSAALAAETPWPTPTHGGVLDKVLQLQYADWLPDNILMRQDKMSMAHSLEARVPFLDHKLVEFMETVPDHLKLRLRRNKILLRNYAARNGLQRVAQGKKSAFYFPMEEYFGSATFQGLLADTLNQRQIRERGLFQYSAITDLIHKMKNKDFLAAKQIFSLVSLELWFQVFIDKKYNFHG